MVSIFKISIGSMNSFLPLSENNTFIKNASPRKIALYVASLLSALVFLLLLLSDLLIHKTFSFIPNFIVLVISFTITYTLFNYAINEFIYGKIKLVYKTIHQLKVSRKEDLKRRIVSGADIISEVNSEVLEWAKVKKQEIDELKKLEEFRREFIGNLAHELKTPIFNIQGYVSTLIETGLEDKEIAEKYLANTEKNIERMISLVEDLDTISRLESGQMHLELERFDITKLLKEVLDMTEMKAKAKNIKTEFKEDYNETYVIADKNTIKQVATNLIMNSIIYGNENGTTKIGIYDMDENILVEIADDGPGIEEKHLNRLFERFYRVDKSRSRNQGGTGLGLSIVKHIIEAHQQTIHARSKVGKGSTFSFTLKKA